MVLDRAIIERIRAIFVHHESRVTLAEAADLLGWSRTQMDAAIRNGDIEPIETCSGKRIELRELAGQALSRWDLPLIEEALGRDASLILPPALRTRKLTVRLPLYQIAGLKILAADGSESVDKMLTLMFHELCDNNDERLSRLIPGFAEAIAWPEREEMQQPFDRTDLEVISRWPRAFCMHSAAFPFWLGPLVAAFVSRLHGLLAPRNRGRRGCLTSLRCRCGSFRIARWRKHASRTCACQAAGSRSTASRSDRPCRFASNTAA